VSEQYIDAIMHGATRKVISAILRSIKIDAKLEMGWH